MATKYSDYIKMQDFLPVYDMTDETPDMWRTFIPTKQFCDLLQRSITAITSSDISKRRSMWVRGTFGTGKSHASSVVRHLLCDPSEEIDGYIQSIPNEATRAQLTAIRKQKRYFPVVLKGVEGAYNIPRFSLSIQRETKKALVAAGYPDLIVRSDFDEAIRWVESHENRIPELLENNDELASEASNYTKLLTKLRNNDIDVFMHLEEALAADKTYLTSDSISEWLVEVEKEIEKAGIADGLIIFWDEFTSVMDTLKSDRINVLQNIAEKSQNNNVFLYLISHRTESSSLDAKGKDITKMSDRYDSVDYQMDEISTYLILRHTFSIPDMMKMNISTWGIKDKIDKSVYNYLCESNNQDEKEHIQNLFPLHPYTAFLCSKMANIMGSANRSVLKFMNDEHHGFKQFINEPTNYDQRMMLTADWLWDFFYSEFINEPLCAAFTNVYSSHGSKVDAMGDDYKRVFKVILLLNALSVKFKSSPEKYAPNDKNLKYIFSGDRCEEKMDVILNWLDETKIIARDIFGEFKISVSSYNPAEITKEKNAVASTYKIAVEYLRYNDKSRQEIERIFMVGERLMRKCEPQFYACEEAEAVLRSKLNKYTREKPNYLHVALFFSITDEARDIMENRVKAFSEEFENTMFIIPSEVFTPTAQTHFIDAVAQSNVSRSHFNTDDASQFENAAKEYVAKWKNRMSGGTYTMYFNGKRSSEGIFSNIYSVINKKFSVQVFPNGMESVKALQNEAMTYFANKNFKTLSLQMLQKRTRDELLSFGGSVRPTKQIFLDGENNLVTDTCELTEAAIAGNSWLNTVCQAMDMLIEAAKKKYADRFSLSDILAPLMRPPFGLFANPANYAILGFALRKHKDDLFNPSTSQPVGDEKLNDMIEILLKMWDGGVSEPSNKLLLRFGSVEERNLTSILGEVFNLSIVRGVSMSDLKSLTYAKWCITEFCKQVARYPLWSLLYCDKIKEKENCKKAISDLISLFNQDSYSLPKIKELLKEIKNDQIDLYVLLTNNQNYKNGFNNFIHSIEEVELKDEWLEELEEDLSHMQSEIAFRREEDVKSRVMSFYINKIKTPAQPVYPPVDPFDPNQPVVPVTPVYVPAPAQDQIRKAKNLVKEQTMPSMMWQKVVLDMIESHPEVSQFVIDYLGS
ncbi:MAG: hypothetical protein IKV80_00540 [Bacteroidales bacterium]|nr:hypothetical protein [Bacteroidales bacterium]MBR5780865.1 hypothetical protein [Bacteroidales bacterium]